MRNFSISKLQPETLESIAYVQWFRLQFPREFEYLWHVPNERPDPKEAKILAAMGVKAGIPDYEIALARGGYFGAHFELKATGRPPGSVTDKQHARIIALRKAGKFAYAAIGLDTLKRLTEDYLRMPPTVVETRAAYDDEIIQRPPLKRPSLPRAIQAACTQGVSR